MKATLFFSLFGNFLGSQIRRQRDQNVSSQIMLSNFQPEFPREDIPLVFTRPCIKEGRAHHIPEQVLTCAQDRTDTNHVHHVHAHAKHAPCAGICKSTYTYRYIQTLAGKQNISSISAWVHMLTRTHMNFCLIVMSTGAVFHPFHGQG